jgi:hypothetical protein
MSWLLAHHWGQIEGLDGRRWRLSPDEERVADGIAAKWRVARLWDLPRDEGAVRDAIAFAYMRADLAAPRTIERADGPFAGVAVARSLGCAYLWAGFVHGTVADDWALAYNAHYSGRISDDLSRGLLRSFLHLDTRGVEAVDALQRLGHERCKAIADGDAFAERFRANAMADFLWRSNLVPEAAAWESLERLFFACGPFFWASADAFVWCAPARHVKRDAAGQLHCEDGPALRYADGAEAWLWRGRTIERELLLGRDRLTVGAIRSERNVERRRVMTELYGIARFVRDAGAEKIAEDRFGTLWAQPEGRLVEVTNATIEPDGTRRRYFLRVPPWVRTPREAVAWTFGLRAEEYDPEHET